MWIKVATAGDKEYRSHRRRRDPMPQHWAPIFLIGRFDPWRSEVGGAVMLALVRRVPPRLVLNAIGARPVARWEAPVLYEIIDALCRRAGLERVPDLCWVGERFPVAFTIGVGEATTIALSEGLIRGMTAREIRGIL